MAPIYSEYINKALSTTIISTIEHRTKANMHTKFNVTLIAVLMIIMLSACEKKPDGSDYPDSIGYYVIDSGKFIALEKSSQIYGGGNGKVMPHSTINVSNSKPFKIVIYGYTVPGSPMLREIGLGINDDVEKYTPDTITPKKVDAGIMIEVSFDKNLTPGEYVLFNADEQLYWGEHHTFTIH